MKIQLTVIKAVLFSISAPQNPRKAIKSIAHPPKSISFEKYPSSVERSRGFNFIGT